MKNKLQLIVKNVVLFIKSLPEGAGSALRS